VVSELIVIHDQNNH